MEDETRLAVPQVDHAETEQSALRHVHRIVLLVGDSQGVRGERHEAAALQPASA